MLTKTQTKIMTLFTSSITKSFNTTTICNELGLHRKNVIEALKVLAQKKLINMNYKLYNLNYQENHQQLSYIEYLRSETFLKKNRYIKLLVSDILDKLSHPSFTFLLFGSSILNAAKANDVDLLLIVETKKTAEEIEKIINKIKSPLKIDMHVFWYASVYEMLRKREENTLLHEVLNKHIIFHGAETFYRLITRKGEYLC